MLNSTTTCAGSDIAGVISQTCTTQYAESSSTDQIFYSGYTQGEIVINVFLFLQLALAAVVAYHLFFRRVKIKNQ